MSNKAWIVAVVATIALAGCGTTKGERALTGGAIGAAAGAATGAIVGAPGVGAGIGAGVGAAAGAFIDRQDLDLGDSPF
ncbi:MAG: YMGG-like glycine zipper-containing protein [Pseudomonadota bacterium]